MLRITSSCLSRYLRLSLKSPTCASPWLDYLHHYSTGSATDGQGADTLPREATVVICGGGIAGLSAAYQLAKMGLTDVVLLEQGSLTCGTTWHSAAQITHFKKEPLYYALSKMSASLYERLEEETGLSTGFKRIGSMILAQTKDRLIDIKRNAALTKTRNIEYSLLTPSEINSIVPWIRTDDLEGAIYFPNDPVTDPTDTSMSLARGAKNRGVKIVEGVQVKGVLSQDGKVSQVQTSVGDIKCEYFVNAAGQWARDVGLASQPVVNVPMHSTAHTYLITKPLPGGVITKGPYVRDFDNYIYMREWSGGLMCGTFSPKAKPIFHDGIPEKSEFLSLPEDWDLFQFHMERFLHRVPAAERMEVKQLFAGPESFTPDLMWLFGEAAEMKNYYLMAGGNSLGITIGGGLGQLLAELIVQGRSSLGYWLVDVQRFSPQHNNKVYLRDRATEIEAYNYKLSYPHNQYKTGRKLRCTSLYTRLAQAGAVFGEMMGVEQPMWFMEEGDTADFVEDVQRGTFSKPGWFDMVKAEYWACRESVCVMDMSFTKFELEGKSATSLLQRLCPNDMDVPVGSVVHSGMLNERGGYENDCSVARFDEDRYFLVCPTIQQVKGNTWITSHLPRDGSVTLKDVTSQYTGLNVLGPKARDVLQKLTSTPLDSASIKPYCCKEMNLGYATGVRAMTITHAGEDGMLLYIPNESAVHVYDELMEAGRNYSIRPAGYHALRWLRTEKFYSYWGVDFNSEHTPFETGREIRVNFNKGVEFIGQSALLKQQKEGASRRLVVFIIEDHNVDRDLWCWGGEPIYHNGQVAGMTTSSGFSPSLGSLMCLGWLDNANQECGQSREVTHDYVTKAKYEIDIAGQMFPARANLYPPKLVTKQPLYG